ncbi:putative ammonium transporter 1 [Anneissia japonica]|uniref:putative ammonium transporter 1 n=1 Tax=Anneissia japonica TaxID=1529436 RepID=UPI001425572A|nr:putative ammonium transporter 1 [Anneissia japonica]
MTMNGTDGNLQSLEDALSALQTNSDLFFKIMMACMIFFMQCGFAFLEAGSVRSKNTTNILIKNFLDVCIGSVFYWAVGYAFAYGPGNKFIGTDWFFMKNMPTEQVDDWFFQFVFAATAATIVSGSMAERTEFVAYLVYSVILTGFIYPVVTHWAWSDDGWLTEMPNNEHIGFQDFAGSAVVHILGGSVALIGAAMLGPRIGRFDDNGKVIPIHGHTVPLVALGGFILFFGFLGFNGGSQGSISNAGDGVVVAESIVNTVLSGGVGALCALFIKLVLYKGNLWSLLTTINGGLTGMVAICAGCDVVEPWGAFVIGFVAGMVFIVVSNLMLKFKIDDPLDAVAVHMGGGFWGIIAVTVFARDTGIVYAGDSDSFLQLLWNIIGSISIFAWSLVTSLLMFGVMRAVGILRVSSLIEEKGLDIAKHGEAAYPLTAYGHGWVNVVEVETGLNGNTKQFDTVPNHIRRESYAGGLDNTGYSQDDGNKDKPVMNSQIEESYENVASESTNF